MNKMINKYSSTSSHAAHFLKGRQSWVWLAVGIVISLVIGVLMFRKGQRPESEQPAAPKAVELKIGQEKARKDGEKVQQQATFLLRPLPDELLQQVASMENLNSEAAGNKFSGMRVLWPAYYYAHQDAGEGKATLLLDVSEDGFGVLLESEVELAAYPELNTLQVGQKIWIGGEILAVDPAGTGTIQLKTEHLQFNGEQPQPGQPPAH